MSLATAKLFFREALGCFSMSSHFVANTFVGEVKVRLKKYNGSEFVNSKAISLLDQFHVNDLMPSFVRVTRFHGYTCHCSFKGCNNWIA
jgi:hypothetical protein